MTAFASFVVALGVYSIRGRGWWIQFCSNKQVFYVPGASEGYYWWVRDGFLQSARGMEDWEVFLCNPQQVGESRMVRDY